MRHLCSVYMELKKKKNPFWCSTMQVCGSWWRCCWTPCPCSETSFSSASLCFSFLASWESSYGRGYCETAASWERTSERKGLIPQVFSSPRFPLGWKLHTWPHETASDICWNKKNSERRFLLMFTTWEDKMPPVYLWTEPVFDVTVPGFMLLNPSKAESEQHLNIS